MAGAHKEEGPSAALDKGCQNTRVRSERGDQACMLILQEPREACKDHKENNTGNHPHSYTTL